MSQKNFLLAITPTFVLICSIITANSEIPVKATDAAYNSPAPDRASRAFLRLRSCHRVLGGESGDFFSPDFLCSNPPLWCNWTVAAPPGSRIRLHLQDYTPAEACHLKRDQVHLDEAPGSGRHRTLERCWGDAVYTSDSSVLHVVLLIDAGLEPPYRGFHARYHTFGLPQTPAPAPAPTQGNNLNWGGAAGEGPFSVSGDEQAQMDAGLTGSAGATPAPSLKGGGVPKPASAERTAPEGRAGSGSASPARPREAEAPGVTEEGPPQPERGPEDPRVEGPSDDPGVSDRPANDSPSNEIPAEAAGEEGPGAVEPPVQAPKPPAPPAADPPAKTPPESREREREPDEDDASEPGPRSTRMPRGGWGEGGGLGPPRAHSAHSAHGDVTPPPGPPVLREKADVVRWFRNSSTIASLPGEKLFEVTVEVRLTPGVTENWDHIVRSVMSSVQAMIQNELRAHVVPKTISSIRIKRLSAGVLFIFWLHFGDVLDPMQVHRILLMALPPLQSRKVNSRGRQDQPTIALISSEDVNECGTQLVLCDVNAACLNRFGSYACRCRAGFQDRSRLGSGGTLCVGPTGTGPSPARPGPGPALLHFLYGLCFLLAALVLVLLGVVAALYRRHHRGAFPVPCYAHQSADSAASSRNGAPLPPPPPPPVRRPKDGWGGPQDKCPSADLPLLKFAPLPPPDAPLSGEQEGGDKP